ncbi:DUF503 domain-containing protein [Spirochaeta lutea]|uniref:DUF503 domain-containing protein n=1 Tax=Spirochaeta lutea TaxID=1480694 RepID=A0A098QU47_9SPIO|nr:DUF503 domain-containing protein [Spirochaeta lutea]KGE71345.1 hypothetical protein DC28_11065 [Spirochaeta lutea]
MVISMLQFVVELPDTTSLKEKRKVIKGLKGKIIDRFKVSAAEVDLHESLTFGQIGVALVSNDKQFGESVMHKILNFAERWVPGRIQDVEIYSEQF